MFERLLKRLISSFRLLNLGKQFGLMIDGFSVEFYRYLDYVENVRISLVPNQEMDPTAIPDYNRMLGISSALSGTDAEKISRIIKKSDHTGFPGPDWFEDQIQESGYPLFVIEQEIQPSAIRQWGDFQFSDFLQFGITERFINPASVPGVLIVGDPYASAGAIYQSQYAPAILDVYNSAYGNGQYGDLQFGEIEETIITQYGSIQYGNPDLSYTYPRGREYELTTDPNGFGMYFFLSPFEDRLAVDESEFLELSIDEYNYLRKLIIESKLVRNRCIAQVKVV